MEKIKVLGLTMFISVLLSSVVFAYGKGDLNNDMKINSEDAALLMQHLIGSNELTEEELQFADCNLDGIVDILDAIWILNNVGEVKEELIATKVSSYPLQFTSDGKYTSGWYLMADGNDIYLTSYGGTVYKFNIEDKENIKYVKKSVIDNERLPAIDSDYINSAGGTSHLTVAARFRSISCIDKYGDYLFATSRDTLGVNVVVDEGDTTTGKLMVLDKDLNVIKSIYTPFKGTRVVIRGDLCIVNMQNYGFAVYDISNPDIYNPNSDAVPELIWDFNDGIANCEYQDGDFIEKNGRLYYLCANFGYGVSMVDITDIDDYVKGEKTDKTLEEIIDNSKVHYIARLGLNDYSQFTTKSHTFDLVIDNENIYTTIAPAANAIGTSSDFRGLLNINFDDIDLNNITVNTPYKYANIPVEYRSTYINPADPQPARLTQYKNYILSNSGNRGIVAYELDNNGAPEFSKLIQTSDRDDAIVNPLVVTDDGYLITADATQSGLTGGRYLQVYKLEIK